MPAAPQNRFHILVTRLNELSQSLLEVVVAYEDRRKGSKYKRVTDPLQKGIDNLKKQVLELGAQYNIVVIEAKVEGINQTMFLTNISTQDAKDLLSHVFPEVEILKVQEVATKKWFTIG